MQQKTHKRQNRQRGELQLRANTAPAGRQTPDRRRQQSSIPKAERTSAKITPYPGRPVQSIKRRRARRRRALFYRGLALALFFLFLVGIFQLTGLVYRSARSWIQSREVNSTWSKNDTAAQKAENPFSKPDITVDLLDVNRYSRPGTDLKKVKNIFVHYTANQGTSAEQNRGYFANLAETGERSASAHFIIGYKGEIIQCIPLSEEAYAVKGRNDDSISIECCYLSEDGAFTSSTYNSLIELLSWLCGEYGLTPEDILRHYDAGGKKCPLYYVENEEAWDKLLEDVSQYMEESASE